MAEIGGGKGESSSSSQVTLPQWLKPFVENATNTASGALHSLRRGMYGDTVADLTPEQLAGLQSMRDLLGGDYFGTAQNTFMNAAQGMGENFLSPELRNYLGAQDFDPAEYIGGMRDALSFTDSPVARGTLEATAGGDYLFGGEGFDRAVEAAVNRAKPLVASAFGGSVGGASGAGLADVALGQAAIDAFASQYGQERGRMLGAAESLESGGRADRGFYGTLAEGQKQREFGGNQFLANLSNAERQRQLAAAAGLPDIGMLDANTQMQIGEYLQGQQQRELSGPLENMLRLFMAASGGPGQFAPFLGQNQQGEQSRFGFGLTLGGD